MGELTTSRIGEDVNTCKINYKEAKELCLKVHGIFEFKTKDGYEAFMYYNGGIFGWKPLIGVVFDC